MATTNTYLNFNGNCEEAFTFYKSVFGGEFTYLGRFSEMPPSDDYKLSVEDSKKLMHVSLPIGASILMGSDIIGEQMKDFVVGSNFSISVNTDSKDEAELMFNALAQNGIVTMPLANTFWGDYFGMLTDKFGVNWMISFNDQSQTQ
jgi:PhnB protein